MYAASSCLREISTRLVHQVWSRIEQAAALFLAASAVVGWLNSGKPLDNSEVIDVLYEQSIERRMAACDKCFGPNLSRELWNISVAIDPIRHNGLLSFGTHVLNLFSTKDGRKELTGNGLAKPEEIALCSEADFSCAVDAVALIKSHDAGGSESADAQTLNPRVFVGVFSEDEALKAGLAPTGMPAASSRQVSRSLAANGSNGSNNASAAAHLAALNGWDHDALVPLRRLSREAVTVITRAVFLGMLLSSKKKFEAGIAKRLRLAPGETGGRYRCVAPSRLLVDGFTRLMSDENIATLKRDRIVVIDDVLPPEILQLAQQEALRMAAEDQLKGELNSTCNPGERSTEMALWDASKLNGLAQQSPGLHHCVRSLWNLPAKLGPSLELDVRVPQVVLLASYPPGALYHRHLDSYDGKDIPRLLTVLLYLQYDPQEGGELKALNCPNRTEAEGGPEWTIKPIPGRLCVFYSQEIEHMVLPSVGQRYALTLWVWDVKKDASGR